MGVENKIAVRAIIEKPYEARGKDGILIIQRAVSSSTGPGEWCVPGGKAEGRELSDAVIDEVLVETSLRFEPDPEPFMEIGPGMEQGYRTFYFIGQANGLVKLNDESDCFTFAVRENMGRYKFAFPGNLVAITKYLDEKYMRIAVDEAMKCRDEDEKLHPKVGAVIVKDGQVLVKAHRNENGKGSHAEYWAFKKARERNIDVKGAVLYTTLEPCTVRKENVHETQKVPCAEHIAASGVSHVIIGMLDPNPKIQQVGFRLLHELGIRVYVGPLESQVKELNRMFVGKYCH